MITTVENIENYLLIDIDDEFVPQIESWISGIENYINDKTDRKIIADDADMVYLYDGNGKESLVVDDFFSITSVTVGGDDVTSSFLKYPANSIPTTKLMLPYSRFYKGRQNVVVTGRQGFCASDAIPEDIVLAATILVAGIINYSNASQGEVASETIGRYSVTYKTDAERDDFSVAKGTLERYKRFRY